MPFGEREMVRQVADIWMTMFGQELETGGPMPDGAAPEELLVGRIAITGDWVGTVRLDCPAELARRIAGPREGGERQVESLAMPARSGKEPDLLRRGRQRLGGSLILQSGGCRMPPRYPADRLSRERT